MNAHATHGANCACHNCAPELSPYAHRRPPVVEPMRPRGVVLKRDTRAAMASAPYPQPRKARRFA